MKSNPLRTALEWVLITSLLLAVFFFMRFFNTSREGRRLQPELQQAMLQSQRNRVAMTYLVGSCEEYAKTHPDMNRLLDALKAQPAPPATPAVPGK